MGTAVSCLPLSEGFWALVLATSAVSGQIENPKISYSISKLKIFSVPENYNLRHPLKGRFMQNSKDSLIQYAIVGL
jgi:hypothetical protein